MFAEVVVVSLSVLTIYFLESITKQEPPILNVYRKNDAFYYVKFVFMYLVLQLRKFSANRKKVKLIANKPFSELEKPQVLTNHKRALDAVYFSGGSKNGNYLVLATSRRQNKLIDGFMFLKIKDSDYGVLETLKVPRSDLLQKNDEHGFAAEGIKIECTEPMRKWKISFEGQLKAHSDHTKIYDVRLNLEFTSDLPYINFDTDADPFAMASAMAVEKWSRSYFETLKAVHQTHYEQFGKVTGEAIIEGKSFNFDVDLVRDHSYGLREWRSFHRYVLHFFTTDNGDRFAVFNISMPICFSNITMGYVVEGDTKKIHTVSWSDFELYQQGESQPMPVDYGFTFKAGANTYTVEVTVHEAPYFYISKNWESKIYEGMATFKINGRRAWGITEWQYRNIQGKEVAEAKQKPHLFN